LPEIPLELRKKLGDQSIPIIAGITSEDGALYTVFYIPESLDGGFTREEFQYYLRERLVNIWMESADSEEIYENSYQAIEWYYTPWPYIDDLEANRQAFNTMVTDGAFGYPWDRQSKINSEHAPTYTYVEKFRSLSENDTIPEWIGNPHSGELAYVWGYCYLQINAEVRQQSGINLNFITGDVDDDIPYADYMQTLWTNFAKYGNPTPTPVKAPFNDTMTSWPRFSANDNHKVLYLDSEISVVENYRHQEYAFFTEYLRYVTKKPLLTKKSQSKVSGRPREKYQMKTVDQQTVITNYILDLIQSKMPEIYEEVLQKLQDDE
jgi:carboxylesterase type B